MGEELTGKEKYRLFLMSPEWKAKREEIKKRCNGMCERCDINPFAEVHHGWKEDGFAPNYSHGWLPRGEDGNKWLSGLCKQCHLFLHNETKIDPWFNQQKKLLEKAEAYKDELLNKEIQRIIKQLG